MQMTPEEALYRAKFQLPGIKIIVGPTEAREERIQPVADHLLCLKENIYPAHKSSWGCYYMWKRLGYANG